MQKLSRLLSVTVFVILPIVGTLYFAPPPLLLASSQSPQTAVPAPGVKFERYQIGPGFKNGNFMSNIIARGSTEALDFMETGGESSNKWYIQKNEIPISTNLSPNDWNLAWNGASLSIIVPNDAVIANDYNAIHIDGSSTQRAATFEVVEGAPITSGGAANVMSIMIK